MGGAAVDCAIKDISTDRIHLDTKVNRNLAAISTCADVVTLVLSNRTSKKRSGAEEEEGRGLFVDLQNINPKRPP